MRAALLCNGPSKTLFDLEDKKKYNYILGCNIPWTYVDATMIVDVEVARYVSNNIAIDKFPVWFSRDSWRELHRYDRENFEFLGLIDRPLGDSSGHAGLRKLIDLGYTEIDIYGCDSYFRDDTISYTHQYVRNVQPNVFQQIKRWRTSWNSIIEKHKDVFINFVWYK